MLEIIGYIVAILIGISLGLTGSGGSIITVPVLVYFMNVNPVTATMYSLFVVGSCSLVGSLGAYKKGLVDVPVVFLFGSASIFTVFVIRHYLIPVLPDHFFTNGPLTVTKSSFLMLLFASLMLFTSVSMIRLARRQSPVVVSAKDKPRKILPLFLMGVAVGNITGVLGVGGGFLIIPALVLFGKLPMKTAVGSSLTIITFSSLFGFFGNLAQYTIHWNQLFLFTAIAISGIFIGMSLSDRLSSNALKKGFGWFVLVIAIAILIREFSRIIPQLFNLSACLQR